MKKIFKVVPPPAILDWVLTIMCFIALVLLIALVVRDIVRPFDVELIKHLNLLASQR
jgi:hypothetical protein